MSACTFIGGAGGGGTTAGAGAGVATTAGGGGAAGSTTVAGTETGGGGGEAMTAADAGGGAAAAISAGRAKPGRSDGEDGIELSPAPRRATATGAGEAGIAGGAAMTSAVFPIG